MEKVAEHPSHVGSTLTLLQHTFYQTLEVIEDALSRSSGGEFYTAESACYYIKELAEKASVITDALINTPEDNEAVLGPMRDLLEVLAKGGSKRQDGTSTTISKKTVVVGKGAKVSPGKKRQRADVHENQGEVFDLVSVNGRHSTTEALENLSERLVVHSEVFFNYTSPHYLPSEERRFLFSKSSLRMAIKALLSKEELKYSDPSLTKLLAFWKAIDGNLPGWKDVREGNLSVYDFHKTYVHSHQVFLQVFASLGHFLYNNDKGYSIEMLDGLQTIDWRISNDQLWGHGFFSKVKDLRRKDLPIYLCDLLKRELGIDCDAEQS